MMAAGGGGGEMVQRESGGVYGEGSPSQRWVKWGKQLFPDSSHPMPRCVGTCGWLVGQLERPWNSFPG